MQLYMTQWEKNPSHFKFYHYTIFWPKIIAPQTRTLGLKKDWKDRKCFYDIERTISLLNVSTVKKNLCAIHKPEKGLLSHGLMPRSDWPAFGKYIWHTNANDANNITNTKRTNHSCYMCINTNSYIFYWCKTSPKICKRWK